MLEACGQLDEARSEAEAALRLDAKLPEAQFNLGCVARRQGDMPAAEQAFRAAIALRPAYVRAFAGLGAVLRLLGRLDEAEAAIRATVQMEPGHPDHYVNLANILADQYRLEEAEAALVEALAMKPDLVEALNALGNLRHTQGRRAEAIELFTRALAVDPRYAEAHFNRSLVMLQQGELEYAWPEFEWRWSCVDFSSRERRQAGRPWNGAPLDGKTVLVQAEQGLGDTLQFARYAMLPRLAGGRAVLQCQPELKRLLAASPLADQVVARGEDLPEHDESVPLLSMPYLHQSTLQSLPHKVPYLVVLDEWIDAWRSPMAGDGLKAGIVWSGNPDARAWQRSVSLADLEPLLEISGVQWFSLQKGAAASQLAELRSGLSVVDLGAGITDFADTAAIVSQLDLVVSIDTSVAHLAGALGKPLWLLLTWNPDWRWLLDRDDSPWYPTARLFRQASPGDWRGVVERLGAELVELVKERKGEAVPA
ncbi:MAG: tetratricopeptide repeat protein [Chloroflexi bacterium]|nr:tetratricopeptide repeat protein [Chloroflexota bacterium]